MQHPSLPRGRARAGAARGSRAPARCALLLALGAAGACSRTSAAEPVEPRLETRPALTLLHVPLDEEIRKAVVLFDPTAADVLLRKGRSSCSCVTIEDQEHEALVPAGGTLEIPLRIHSTRSGLKRERLLFLVSTGDQEPTLLELPIALLTGPPIYTEPRSLLVSGAANARVDDAFTVASYWTGDAGGPLRWDVGESGLRLEPKAPRAGPLSTGTLEETTFAVTIPELAPGSYAFPIDFWRVEGGREVGRVRRSLALLVIR